MRIGFARFCVVVAVAAASSVAVSQPPSRHKQQARSAAGRQVELLDKGWSIYKLPEFQLWPATAKLSEAQIEQLHVPADGQGWRPVRVPDDYVVAEKIAREPNPVLLAGGAVCVPGAPECEPPGTQPSAQPKTGKAAKRSQYGGHGYLPLYPAWYRRTLRLPASAQGKRIWLDFGGVYRDAVVFVNGRFVQQHAGGYAGFRMDITPSVRYGAENTIAVFVDPRWWEGWWYEGGGIYRHVELVVTDPLQVSPWGTFVQADVADPIHHGGTYGESAAAKLTIQTTVRNDSSADRRFTLVSRVVGASGKLVASASSTQDLAAGKEQTFAQPANLLEAKLWSLEHRNLYKLETVLSVQGRAVDNESTTFGVRKLRFDSKKGFFLNDQRVEIQGMCVHQDFPGVGIGAADNLWAWRMEKMQAMGTNAVRTSHGPESEAFYDDADRMGMLVMAENRHLGDTYLAKSDDTTPYSDLSDLKTMVLQQRNHPSIIMWSMSNEEAEGGKPHGGEIFATMKALVRQIDPTRPVTAAIVNGINHDGLTPLQDVLGINYHITELAKIHKDFPGVMMYGSEDVNAKTSRGTLESSPTDGLCSEYGCDATRDTGPFRSWEPVMRNSFMAGEFVWTAFDYRGEPNPFSWPAVTSQTGAMDITGAPKPVYYYWRTEWQSKPSVYIFPEWDLPASEVRKDVLVRAFSNCERVELLLNGKSLGAKDMPRDLYLDWTVPYTRGTLTAVGYNHGQEVARYSTQPAGKPASLRLTAEVPRLNANGEDVAPIEVAVLDAQGRVVPAADNLIRFAVSGEGELAGVENGNPVSREPVEANERHVFRGLEMVLVRAGEHPGSIRVEAQADGLAPARVVIPTARVAIVLPTR